VNIKVVRPKIFRTNVQCHHVKLTTRSIDVAISGLLWFFRVPVLSMWPCIFVVPADAAVVVVDAALLFYSNYHCLCAINDMKVSSLRNQRHVVVVAQSTTCRFRHCVRNDIHTHTHTHTQAHTHCHRTHTLSHTHFTQTHKQTIHTHTLFAHTHTHTRAHTHTHTHFTHTSHTLRAHTHTHTHTFHTQFSHAHTHSTHTYTLHMHAHFTHTHFTPHTHTTKFEELSSAAVCAGRPAVVDMHCCFVSFDQQNVFRRSKLSIQNPFAPMYNSTILNCKHDQSKWQFQVLRVFFMCMCFRCRFAFLWLQLLLLLLLLMLRCCFTRIIIVIAQSMT